MKLHQLVKFGAVGLANSFVGLSTIYALKLLLGAGDVAANVMGYSIGMIVSFGLNRQWTFNYQGGHWSASLRFMATMVFSYGLNLLLVLVSIHVFHLNSYLAQLLGVPPFTITSFLLCKYWVFKEPALRHPAPTHSVL